MARGRFISKSLSNSKRAASVSERALLVFCLSLPHASPEGLLDGDPETLLLEYSGRIGARHRWDAGTMTGVLRELIDSGLWVDMGNDVVKIDKFHEHNKIRWDREQPSALAGRTPGALREHSGNLPQQVEGKSNLQGEGEGEARAPEAARRPPPTPAPLPHDANHDGDSWSIADEASRIRLALVPIAPALWTPGGSESELIHRYAREGTCRRWPDGKLAAHLADLHGKIQAKRGKAPDMAYLLRQINADWDPAPAKTASVTKDVPPPRPGDPFGYDSLTGRPYHPGA